MVDEKEKKTCPVTRPDFDVSPISSPEDFKERAKRIIDYVTFLVSQHITGDIGATLGSPEFDFMTIFKYVILGAIPCLQYLDGVEDFVDEASKEALEQLRERLVSDLDKMGLSLREPGEMSPQRELDTGDMGEPIETMEFNDWDKFK